MRRGLGKGQGMGYKNLLPRDSYIHGLSAKGLSTVAQPVFNRKIVDARQLTKKEVDEEGWNRSTTALILDDGTLIYPSQDDEGNDAGALFGKTRSGVSIRLGVQEYLNAKGKQYMKNPQGENMYMFDWGQDGWNTEWAKSKSDAEKKAKKKYGYVRNVRKVTHQEYDRQIMRDN